MCVYICSYTCNNIWLKKVSVNLKENGDRVCGRVRRDAREERNVLIKLWPQKIKCIKRQNSKLKKSPGLWQLQCRKMFPHDHFQLLAELGIVIHVVLILQEWRTQYCRDQEVLFCSYKEDLVPEYVQLG